MGWAVLIALAFVLVASGVIWTLIHIGARHESDDE